MTDLYRASTLGERRPIDDPAILRSMLEHANLVVTAWDEGLLVGLSRTLTDFAYVGYLADLAVRESHQRQGIGLELMRKTRERMGPRSMLVLLAAPNAVDYYPGWASSGTTVLAAARLRSPGRPAGVIRAPTAAGRGTGGSSLARPGS